MQLGDIFESPATEEEWKVVALLQDKAWICDDKGNDGVVSVQELEEEWKKQPTLELDNFFQVGSAEGDKVNVSFGKQSFQLGKLRALNLAFWIVATLDPDTIQLQRFLKKWRLLQ